MNPKMTIKDAADFLGISARKLHKRLLDSDLPYKRTNGVIHFGYPIARQIFRLENTPKAISFQIVKGGTGKTSLASAVAIRANLYGLRVLCIDLDQQGNLTQTFGVDAELQPVMVDILAQNYAYEDAIVRVQPGLHVLGSRIENALLDDVIKLKGLALDQVYRGPLARLKEKYDLIIIDCPPNLGQSVAAVTLTVDQVVAPVVPENYALAGLKATTQAIKELQAQYKHSIPFSITLNKYDPCAILSQQALEILSGDSEYQQYLLKAYVHATQEFPDAIARGQSIFDTVKTTQAKRDIDNLTRELLGIGKHGTVSKDATEYTASVEESFA